MAAGVLDQVVAAHEALVAQRALEALLSRVSAGVAGQLVGAGKLLLAVGPGAREGPLTCSTVAEEMAAKSKHSQEPVNCHLFLYFQLSLFVFYIFRP